MAGSAAAPDTGAADPPLLRDNSRIRTYTAARSGIEYPGLRVFFRPHPKAAELPADPAPLPLIVFVHGLGGSVAQFYPLLSSLTNSASTLAVDLPGCGQSLFEPRSWSAYSTDALVDLLETVINDHRVEHQGVVFVAHSMGTVLAARLANHSSPTARVDLSQNVMGLIAICPVAGPLPEATANSARKLLWIPEFVFNLWRAWDRWGGPESASVRRFVGPNGDKETRLLQDRFNSQSRSGVFRRMAWGSLPTYVDNKPVGGLFGEPTWAGLDIPVYLIAGEHDKVTPPTEISRIVALIEPNAVGTGSRSGRQGDSPTVTSSNGAAISTNAEARSASLGDAAAPVNLTTSNGQRLPASIEAIRPEDFNRRQRFASPVDSQEDPSTPRDPDGASRVPPQPRHPPKIVKATVLPSGHALMYAPTVVRTLAGLIGDFLNENITGRFSL